MSKQEENFISYVHRMEAEHRQLTAILLRLKTRLSHENISNLNIDLLSIMKEADKITEGVIGMNKTIQRQEGIIIFLVIVAVGSVLLGVIFNDNTLLFGGVAIILLDTALLLDYKQRQNRTLNDKTSKESIK